MNLFFLFSSLFFVFVLVALILAVLTVGGCATVGVDSIGEEEIEEGANMAEEGVLVGKVTTKEIEKEREHEFTYYYDKDRGISVAEGGFSIEGGEYPGRIIFFEDKSLLIKPNPDECIEFPDYHAIYGYLPPESVMHGRYDELAFMVNITEKDEYSMEYSVFSFDSLQNSEVQVGGLRYSTIDRVGSDKFEIPDGIECVDYEAMIRI
jgi:hypothetical protein